MEYSIKGMQIKDILVIFLVVNATNQGVCKYERVEYYLSIYLYVLTSSHMVSCIKHDYWNWLLGGIIHNLHHSQIKKNSSFIWNNHKLLNTSEMLTCIHVRTLSYKYISWPLRWEYSVYSEAVNSSLIMIFTHWISCNWEIWKGVQQKAIRLYG